MPSSSLRTVTSFYGVRTFISTLGGPSTTSTGVAIPTTSGGLSTGAKAGIGVAVACGFILIATIIFCLLHRKRWRNPSTHGLANSSPKLTVTETRISPAKPELEGSAGSRRFEYGGKLELATTTLQNARSGTQNHDQRTEKQMLEAEHHHPVLPQPVSFADGVQDTSSDPRIPYFPPSSASPIGSSTDGRRSKRKALPVPDPKRALDEETSPKYFAGIPVPARDVSPQKDHDHELDLDPEELERLRAEHAELQARIQRAEERRARSTTPYAAVGSQP